jgi:hypothetical protein
MATESYAGALNILSIGGNSQLEFIENANYTFTEEGAEGAPASRFGGNDQGTKMSGKIEFSLFSDQATDVRVSHLDLSAATWGSVNLLSPNILSNMQVRIQMVHKMNPGTGQLWAYPIVADGKFEGSLKLGMDRAAVPQILIDMFSATYGDKNRVLAFTLNSVGVSVPFRQKSAAIPVEKDGLMEYTLDLADRSARAGVTVLPSGTTSLLEKAINQPKTALAFVFRPASHPSINISGNMVWETFELNIEDGKLVPSKLTFATQGTVTGAATSS